MTIYINDKKLNQPKTKFITNHNKSLAEYTIKPRLLNDCSNISMKTIFINTKNSSLT